MKLTTQRVFLGLAVALVIYQASIAVGATFLADDSDRWFFVVISALGAVIASAGLKIAKQAPTWSGLLIAVGVLPSIIMFWVIIPPIIALWVAVYAVYNGRRQQRGLETGA